jgi:hypothetical protein
MPLPRPPFRALFDLELQAFEQRLEAGAAERDRPRTQTRLYRELPLLEALAPDTEAIPVEVQHLQLRAPAVYEQKA